MTAKRTRFYCQTSGHSRKMHFYTSDAVVNQIAYDGNDQSNTASRWNTGFTTLSGHSANLPAATNGYETGASFGFWNFPFYTRSGANHWGIRGGGYRWECDDYTNEAQTTLHQVWVNAEPGTYTSSLFSVVSILITTMWLFCNPFICLWDQLSRYFYFHLLQFCRCHILLNFMCPCVCALRSGIWGKIL